MQSTAASVLLSGIPRESCGPIAGAEVMDAKDVGWICHPAVLDSSMHIGILAGRDDSKMRIPGILCPNCRYSVASQCNCQQR